MGRSLKLRRVLTPVLQWSTAIVLGLVYFATGSRGLAQTLDVRDELARETAHYRAEHFPKGRTPPKLDWRGRGPLRAKEATPEKVPGGVGYGYFFYDSELLWTNSTIADYYVITPTILGPDASDQVYLTSTCRAQKGTESLIWYDNQNEAAFWIFDWSLPSPQFVFGVDDFPSTHPEYLTSRPDEFDNIRQMCHIRNGTFYLGASNGLFRWMNQVMLFNFAREGWDLVYETNYTTTNLSDNLFQSSDSGGNEVGHWGPIVETFSTYTNVDVVGFDLIRLFQDSNPNPFWLTRNNSYPLMSAPWQLLTEAPNTSFTVAASATNINAGTYNIGTLCVTAPTNTAAFSINPPGGVDTSNWVSTPGGTWDRIVVGLPPGNYSITFAPAPGLITPALQNFTITADAVTTVQAAYSAPLITNAWTSPVSGSWENLAPWSRGLIPGANQAVMLTNAGWKAVQISPTTAQNFPQSLEVNSVVVSSPSNTFNTLLMNFAGLATPLTVEELSVGSNSAMTMLSSALQINGPAEGGMTIGGQFNQTDSTVSGNQINVGYIGPGVYNFNSGLLNVTYLWVGGPYDGVFFQNGGTNSVGTTHLDGAGAEYVMRNGFYNATTYYNGGTFVQQGGLLDSLVYIFQGSYRLAGGILDNDLYVPGTDGVSPGTGTVLQTGGTNGGSIYVGEYGSGTYTLSNGVVDGPWITLYSGTFVQWGGTQEVSYLDIINEQTSSNVNTFGTYLLKGGHMSPNYVAVFGSYTQTGGTNTASFVETAGGQGMISQSGGLLAADTIGVGPSASLTGGTMVASNTLYLDEGSFVMSGGQLIVSNMILEQGSSFTFSGGAISQSGILTTINASLYAGSTPQSFGPLQLGFGSSSNSTLSMPAGASVVRFGDSRSAQWSGTFTIENWGGSLTGGGRQRISFGNSAKALTSQQVGAIGFHNPVGFAPGTYPARILASGEIVPAAGTIALRQQTGGIQLTFQGRMGSNYNIEVSTDLLHWTKLAHELDTNGTLTFTDTNAPNFPHRFYRATLVP